jgi:transposase InsO family protein
MERFIERRYEFESIYDAGLVMNRWKKHYNERRLHGSLGDKSPQTKFFLKYAHKLSLIMHNINH